MVVQSKSVSTGDDLRDTHLVEEDFFNVEKYPVVNYKASSIEGKVFKGELSLIEKINILDIPFKVEVIDGVHHLKGEIEFDRVEFGMKNQKLAPDDVKVKFDIIIEKK